jgi:hypothetical protein
LQVSTDTRIQHRLLHTLLLIPEISEESSPRARCTTNPEESQGRVEGQ